MSGIYADPAIDLGDRYFASGMYREAITEYYRFIYFNPKDLLRSTVYEKIGRAAFFDNDWPGCSRNMNRAVLSAATPEEKDARELVFAELALAAGQYSTAKEQLKNILAESRDEKSLLRSAFLMGVSSVYTFDWNTAYLMFEEYFKKTSTFSSRTEGRVLALLKFGKNAYYRDRNVAEILSNIIPGAGQMYAGDFFEGLNSLAVTGLCGTLMIYSLVTYRFQDAAITFLFLFQRFYVGSSFHAARIAVEKNREKRTMIASGIMELLLQDAGVQ